MNMSGAVTDFLAKSLGYLGSNIVRRGVFNMMKQFRLSDRHTKLVSCVEMLRDLINQFDKCFITVDAFDECQLQDSTGATRERISETLGDLAPARLLITSRTDVQCPKGWLPFAILTDPSDINAFIRSRLALAPRGFKKLLKSDNDQDEGTGEDGDGRLDRGIIIDHVTKEYGEVYGRDFPALDLRLT